MADILRIDRILTESGIASRSEVNRAAKRGHITCNGKVVRDLSQKVDPHTAILCYDGERIIWRESTFVMLNKPDGYISATDDPREMTVLELLDDRLCRMGMFPCGRLDKDTLGLLILTNDGVTAHRLTSPKHHAEKIYFFRCRDPLTDEAALRLTEGVTLDDGYHTLPCQITREDGHMSGTITLTEGKYHQIKRMLSAVGNAVTYLERISFGGISLDRSLARGAWRLLTDDEIARLKDIQ